MTTWEVLFLAGVIFVALMGLIMMVEKIIKSVLERRPWSFYRVRFVKEFGLWPPKEGSKKKDLQIVVDRRLEFLASKLNLARKYANKDEDYLFYLLVKDGRSLPDVFKATKAFMWASKAAEFYGFETYEASEYL